MSLPALGSNTGVFAYFILSPVHGCFFRNHPDAIATFQTSRMSLLSLLSFFHIFLMNFIANINNAGVNLQHYRNSLHICSFSEENVGVRIRDTSLQEPRIRWTNSFDFHFHIISHYNMRQYKFQHASRKISSRTNVSSEAKREVVLTRCYYSDFLCC